MWSIDLAAHAAAAAAVAAAHKVSMHCVHLGSGVRLMDP